MHLHRRIPSHLVDICSHFYHCHHFFSKSLEFVVRVKKCEKHEGDWGIARAYWLLGLRRNSPHVGGAKCLNLIGPSEKVFSTRLTTRDSVNRVRT